MTMFMLRMDIDGTQFADNAKITKVQATRLQLLQAQFQENIIL